MSAIKLATPSSGSISLTPADTASNLVIQVPAVTGTMATTTTPSFTTTIGVGGATPAASGAGITFPATQSASSDANTLDDYEEGTWTPALTGGSPTYTVQAGWYTKIGNVVTVWGAIVITAKSASATEAGVQGLPFANNLISTSVASWGREYLPAGILPSSAHGAFASVEGTIAYIRNASGSFNSYSMDNLANSGSLTFGVTYRVAT
jgi:hypothetical protein